MTGTSSLGSSGWSSFQRYDTESGQRFFVKQVRDMIAFDRLLLDAMTGISLRLIQRIILLRRRSRANTETCYQDSPCVPTR